MPRRLRLGLPLAALSALLVAVSAGASSSGDSVSAWATAKAAAVSITEPGAPGVAAAAVTAPPERTSPRAPYAYPADGTVVSATTISASVSARWAARSTGQAAADLSGVSLFGGEITADTVAAHVAAAAAPGGATGDYTGTKVLGLRVLGAEVAATPATQVPLANWGTLTVLDQAGQPSEIKGMPGFSVAVTALHVHLLLDHGGLPA
ncbi:MAG: choice-of-anchor P family protein, partial [Gaiellaceae bacterium]